MENEEIWKPIEGFDNQYLVSNLGRVKSLKDSKNEVIMKQSTAVHGYATVSLTKGKNRTFRVHRLVAQAFISNPENKPHVEHINTIRTDNRVENLRWATADENNKNPITRAKRAIMATGVVKSEGTKQKQRESANKNPKILETIENRKKPVMCLETGKKYNSISDAQRDTGIDYCNISKVCRGLQKTCRGTHWIFVDNAIGEKK